MKDAASSLFSSASPSVRTYLKLRSLWPKIMKVRSGGRLLDLVKLTEPLGIYGEELHIGVYTPAVVSAIKRYQENIVRALRSNGINVNRVVPKIVAPHYDDSGNKLVSEKAHFSEELLSKAMERFSMVEDIELRKKLAIVWLKKGGSNSE